MDRRRLQRKRRKIAAITTATYGASTTAWLAVVGPAAAEVEEGMETGPVSATQRCLPVFLSQTVNVLINYCYCVHHLTVQK